MILLGILICAISVMAIIFGSSNVKNTRNSSRGNGHSGRRNKYNTVDTAFGSFNIKNTQSSNSVNGNNSSRNKCNAIDAVNDNTNPSPKTLYAYKELVKMYQQLMLINKTPPETTEEVEQLITTCNTLTDKFNSFKLLSDANKAMTAFLSPVPTDYEWSYHYKHHEFDFKLEYTHKPTSKELLNDTIKKIEYNLNYWNGRLDHFRGVCKKYEAFDNALNDLDLLPVSLSDAKFPKLPASKLNVTYSNIIKSSNRYKLSNFVVIDTETTGLKYSKDSIIEVAAIRFEDFEPVQGIASLVRPPVPIPAEATAINGITDDMVADAPTFESLIPMLSEFVDGQTIIGYNLDFDLRFWYKNGLDFLAQKKRKYYDVCALARTTIPNMRNYRLDTLCSYPDFSIRNPKTAHRALSDCLATGILFAMIVNARLPE